jgi:hypothetical protein
VRAFVRSIALSFVLASMASAQGAPDSVDFGGGASVHRTRVIGAYGPIPAWQAVGWTMPAGTLGSALAFARTYAVVPSSGRVLVALANTSGPFLMTGFAVRVMRSDDHGASWQPITWRWAETVNLFSFEPGTSRGVAVGDSGYVWTTTDGGETWTSLGNSVGTIFVELLAGERETLLIDDHGNVWRMSGGTFARELLLTDTSAHLSRDGAALVVRTDTEELRIRHGHGVDRHRR